MANTYYDPGEKRSTRVRDLFGVIAPRYDWVNDLQSLGMHRLWKRRLIRMARVRRGDRALDLCCGSGDIAFGLARSGADVMGLDFSAPMLSVARARQGQLSGEGAGSRLSFLRGDGQNLPFADGSFDVVTVGYGLRNLSSWERGLEEMWRVARSGGRLLVLDFGKPARPLWRSLYYGYLRCGVPLLGKVFCGDAQAYAYILESLRHYPAQEGVAGFFREKGALEVRVVNLLGGAMSINMAVKP